MVHCYVWDPSKSKLDPCLKQVVNLLSSFMHAGKVKWNSFEMMLPFQEDQRIREVWNSYIWREWNKTMARKNRTSGEIPRYMCDPGAISCNTHTSLPGVSGQNILRSTFWFYQTYCPSC